MRTERELLIDCLERLNRCGLSYMLTGSMASNYWGTPRTTHDLDFVLLLHPPEVDTLLANFRDGFFLQPESVREVFRPPHQFNAIDEQSALKVGFWLLRDDPFERGAFTRRVKLELFRGNGLGRNCRGYHSAQAAVESDHAVGPATRRHRRDYFRARSIT